jgi:septum formation protein
MTGIECLYVLPPSSPLEPGFESMTFDSQIQQRLMEIAALKHADVRNQLPHQPWFSPDNPPVVVVADTTVVTGESDGTRAVLGQPEPELWRQQVREWFDLRLSGRTHEVWTAVIVSRGNTVRDIVVRSRVTFSAISEATMDWYLSTNESPGKAGGYAIQGFAASFVTHMEGSLTNVIGLPLLETMELIRSLPD